MTPVIFKKESGGAQVYAAFPTIAGNDNPQTMACYAHIGQHGIADAGYVRETKPAKPSEYADLLAELRAIGYDDLVIRHRLTRADYLARRGQVMS